MFLRTTHRTTFVYADSARDSFNEVRLCPVDDAAQICHGFVLRVDPDTVVGEYADFYGNTVHYFDISGPHSRLVVEAISEVETVPNATRAPIPVVGFEQLQAGPERESCAEFLAGTALIPLDDDIVRETALARPGAPLDVWSEVARLSRHVHRTMDYRPGSTGVATRASDALRQKAGVCQDFAHVMLGLCRCAGIPARYVSGYFLNLHPLSGEAEASHAWLEAHIPGYGWAAYDPTHDLPVDDSYVKIAVGRDYADIRPICGTYRGGRTREFKVEVTVAPWTANAEVADPTTP